MASYAPKVTNAPFVSASTLVAPKTRPSSDHTLPKISTAAHSVSDPTVPSHALSVGNNNVTPLSPDSFNRYLKLFDISHKFPCLVPFLANGFPIGDSMPCSLAASITQKNYLKSPPEILYAYKYFLDEVSLGRMIGPLPEDQVRHCLWSHFRTSPVGLIPKAGKTDVFRIICDLSHVGEAGWSINGCIDFDCPTIWTTFEEFAHK
jgi:hypothetical protein